MTIKQLDRTTEKHPSPQTFPDPLSHTRPSAPTFHSIIPSDPCDDPVSTCNYPNFVSGKFIILQTINGSQMFR